MAKIPFDIKYRPQIESGEYKVETKDHHPVRIICWNKNTGGLDRIVALVAGSSGQEKTLHYTEEGLCIATGSNRDKDLFIVTPEEELTKFEKDIKREFICAGWSSVSNDIIKNIAAKSLVIARKEALKDLPRWRPAARAYDGDRLPRIDWSLDRLVARFEDGIFYLDIRELYKLPGFKEDESHE